MHTLICLFVIAVGLYLYLFYLKEERELENERMRGTDQKETVSHNRISSNISHNDRSDKDYRYQYTRENRKGGRR